MKIIYHCYGGAHSSPLAAAIHLGKVSPETVPSKDQLMELPRFDKTSNEEHGQIFYMGDDEAGNQVYALGRRNEADLVLRAIKSMTEAWGQDPAEMTFVDTIPCVNHWMRIGGFLSRAVGWVSLGRPLVLHGCQQAYPKLAGLVAQTKEKLGRGEG